MNPEVQEPEVPAGGRGGKAPSVIVLALDASSVTPPAGCEVVVSAVRGACPGAVVVHGPPGRGTQLRAGAAAATGDWLLFLHGDTRLAPGWLEAARAHMAGPWDRAAYFRFALDDALPQARRLERAVAWRCRWLGLPYGDQGLLISRRLHDQLGGYAPMPLMEDVDLIARIGARRLVALPVAAVTSAARWRRDGWRRRSARNLGILALWFAGVSPRVLAWLYARR
ncbi:MAG: glycosyltransferase [Acetobacteraceae bacterium]|nr:glycosyltransferase [Acetobacteraceae bacterium]